MPIRIVQLGSPRAPDEGSRIGTVRRPPRGVPRAEFASRDFYDVWFPQLAPSLETMKLGQAAETPADSQFDHCSRCLVSFLEALDCDMVGERTLRTVCGIYRKKSLKKLAKGRYKKLSGRQSILSFP